MDNQNEEPSISTFPPITSPPPSKPPLLYILIGIFLLILFGIASFFLGQKSKSQINQTVPIPTIIMAPT